ncbi:uncharacterized protein LOC113503822 [Trichoplusia ni]|uniref:Uncharacterized protein LOC113503822 n=1 Tax=Trichoplusia ni TaxID=7111 RepID=A0A7E5WLU1_TRINI|nr:uncharacterized protein LOC113503822 [Trichoplusia ni]
MTYVALQRPRLLLCKTQYVENLTVTSLRYSRKDPLYYLVIEGKLMDVFGNNITVIFDFYQFSNNRYLPTYVGIREKMCDFVDKHNIFGVSLLKSLGNRTCPYHPGFYHLNLTTATSLIPASFPYRQGRMYVNISLNSHGREGVIISGYSDLEMKTYYKKN